MALIKNDFVPDCSGGSDNWAKMVNRVILAVAMVLVCGNVFAAEVVQGKCSGFDKVNKEVALEEYDAVFDLEFPYGHPTGVKSRFDASKAKIGLEPEPGDILRIAYDVYGNRKKAVRVMNVTKQEQVKK